MSKKMKIHRSELMAKDEVMPLQRQDDVFILGWKKDVEGTRTEKNKKELGSRERIFRPVFRSRWKKKKVTMDPLASPVFHYCRNAAFVCRACTSSGVLNNNRWQHRRFRLLD